MRALYIQLLGVFARGVAMGAADLVPGVSGGTMAFITGIYERLLKAIKLGSSPLIWLILLRGQFKVFWKAVDATFMAVLVAGILAAVFTLASPLRYLLVSQTTGLLAFFCGLTVAAAWHVARTLPRFSPAIGAAFVAGALLALAITLSPVTALSGEPPLQGYFLAAIIAFVAMILPGISGSFLLLLLGVYPFLIDAVHNRDLAVLAVFAAGGVVSLALFARLLNRLLVHRHDQTIAFLLGIMLGALPKLWPWKEAGEGVKQILQPAIWPWQAAEPQYGIAIACLVLGLACVLGAERLAMRGQDKAS